MSDTAPINPFSGVLTDTQVVGKRIVWYPKTNSTNDHALECPVDGTVFIADDQAAGRGRHGRKWHSAPGLGLYFSIALAGPLPGISFGAALAVHDALSPRGGVSLRWPNDLYCGQKKIGGILVEQRGERLALGIGVNVNQQRNDFPPYLRHRAGSLYMTTGVAWDRRDTLFKILMHVDAMVQRLKMGEFDAVHAEWIDACNIIGKKIRRGPVVGVVTAVDMKGVLMLQTATGTRRISSGDITASEIP